MAKTLTLEEQQLDDECRDRLIQQSINKDALVKLTPHEKRFVEEYLIDLNQMQACIRAGYSARTADKQGSQIYNRPRVNVAIFQAMAERSKRTGINADRIVLELAKIAFVNPTDVINMNEATVKGEANRNDTATIASVKVKIIPTDDGEIVEREIKLLDKVKTLELLGKHVGMFKDEKGIENLNIVIVDNVPKS